MGFLPELELARGSTELMDARPGMAPLELDLENHFVGFEKNCVKPVDGDADRGKVVAPGERAPDEGVPPSGGHNVLMDGAPLRGGIVTSENLKSVLCSWDQRGFNMDWEGSAQLFRIW